MSRTDSAVAPALLSHPLTNGSPSKLRPFGGLDREDREDREYGENGENREHGDRSSNVVCAISVLSVSPEVDSAIERTQPQFPGQRKRCLFELARELKAIPAFADASARALQPIVVEWCRRAESVMGGEHDVDDCLSELLYGLERVRFPAGNGPLVIAIQRMEESSEPAEAQQFLSHATRRLVHLCCELQGLSGDSPFYLSCRVAGVVVGLEKTVAWKRLGLLRSCGIIEMVQPGTKTRAARYRYLVSDVATDDRSDSA